MTKQTANKDLKSAPGLPASLNITKQNLINRLLDKKFGKTGKKITKDDCDSCGEKCFD
jgi:hypothetical protein